MYWELIGSVLASLGGASVVIAGFAHFLGKIWLDRISKQTAAKYDAELLTLKSKSEFALSSFKTRADAELKSREEFNGISLEVYQGFFQNRVSTYLELLKIKNAYTTKMNEDFVTEETEDWGNAYYSIYSSLRKLVIENQLYISNELEQRFSFLRMNAAEYIKEADMTEGYSVGDGDDPNVTQEQLSKVYKKLAGETYQEMEDFFNQLDADVKKLRSRIEMDKN
ncbi:MULTISPECIES: hypothetical protein [Vibrionaceae]|jgi:hypothetical protein|nr:MULTISPECIES: hypothetical protein [Vibrionaceae]EGR0068477.1 hypothetical protein [Vibrio parahaemolyticus]EGR3325524.1 hypothetical protein [Vibrio parahaemolyticus]EHW0638011.1 hypothetical protein [Vibrio vulnificus]EHZ2765213.1 hypothetical protein [Vibrio vulnificus]EIU7554397.1 hypothetical protein [Vibrio vulnificus]